MRMGRFFAVPAAIIMILVFGLLPGTPGFAGGTPEAEEHGDEDVHGDEDEHDDEGEHHDDEIRGIPDIDPVALGPGRRLSVVATTSIVADIVAAVGGDDIELTVLMERGTNPHAWEPTPRSLARVEEAHMVFVNGLNLEENLMDDLPSVATGYVVPVSAGIDVIDGYHDEEEHDEEEHDEDDHDEDDHVHAEGDPHVWMDPNNAIHWVENIVVALSNADPANESDYERRGIAYIEDLRAVDQEIRRRLASIPEGRRKLVADHESFSYFAEEYGFATVGAIVPNTTDRAEPSARDVAELVELVREEDVSAIFIGQTASPATQRLARAIADEVGREVRIIPTLTGSLAPAGEEGDTYLGFLRYNIEQIFSGLGQ